MSVSAVIIDIVKGVIAELRGKDATDWTTDKVAAAIADKVKEAIAATIATELHVYANALDLRMAAGELAEAASRLLIAMRQAETSPTVPKLNLDITVVGPDEKLEDVTVAAIGERLDEGRTFGTGGGEVK